MIQIAEQCAEAKNRSDLINFLSLIFIRNGSGYHSVSGIHYLNLIIIESIELLKRDQ